MARSARVGAWLWLVTAATLCQAASSTPAQCLAGWAGGDDGACPAALEHQLAWLLEPSARLDDSDAARADLALAAREFSRASDRSALDQRLLTPLLVAIEPAPADARSLFEQLIDWLREWLADANRDVDLSSLQALLDFLERHAWSLGLFARALFVVIIVAALYVVLREIEARGGWRRSGARAARAPKARASQAAHERSVRLTPDTIAALPLARRPAAWLGWLLAELAAQGWLGDNPALTNREHVARLRAYTGAASADLADELASVVAIVEPALYGDRVLDAATEAALAGHVRGLAERAARTRAAA